LPRNSFRRCSPFQSIKAENADQRQNYGSAQLSLPDFNFDLTNAGSLGEQLISLEGKK
jgi:hypothetical protein